MTIPGAQYRVAPSVERTESLGTLLRDAFIQHKGLVALIEADRKREASRWTYAEADAVVDQVAHRLQLAGIGRGERVAVLMTNQPRWLLSAAAVFRRGGVLVPLDYKLETHDQLALLEHAKPQVLVIEWSIWRKLGELRVPHVWVSEAPPGAELGSAQRWEDLPDPDLFGGPAEEIPTGRDDLAAIVYSSGTGGRPKGCMLTHGCYLAQLQGLLDRFPMAPGDVYFSVLPTNHAIDFMVGFLGPFVCGAAVVHQRTLRPEMLRFTMQRYGVTHMSVVPMLLAAFERSVREKLDELPAWQRAALEAALALHQTLTETGPRPILASRLLAPVHAAFGGRLRLLICGGAFTERRLVEFFARLGIPVVVGYGLTEACTAVTVNAVHPLRSDTVGTPLRDVQVRIDASGEVLVAGPTLMRGYLDDPEQTAEVLRDGWLHTGDLGYFDASGHLHLVGRLKDVIVTPGGKNVYPEDVEFAFSALRPDLEDLAVVTANALWPALGMTGEELVLVVRTEEAAADLLRDIHERNRKLASYKRISAVLCWNKPFPRTASMKLKRKVLLGELAAGTRREQAVRLQEVG